MHLVDAGLARAAIVVVNRSLVRGNLSLSRGRACTTSFADRAVIGGSCAGQDARADSGYGWTIVRVYSPASIRAPPDWLRAAESSGNSARL
jgi:hypothetical protein